MGFERIDYSAIPILVVAGFLLIIFGYGVVRAGSFAYFRTKLEYLRSALRELRKENHHNG